MQNFALVDRPGRGMNFQSGHIPALHNGAGITYEIRYRVAGSNQWRVHASGISAAAPFSFSLPQPGNIHYTDIMIFFGNVPVQFARGNQITFSFLVTDESPTNTLVNRLWIMYNGLEVEGNSPQEPEVGNNNNNDNDNGTANDANNGNNLPPNVTNRPPAPDGFLVPDGNVWLQFGEDGTPQGAWTWDDGQGQWVFENNLVPVSPILTPAGQLPQTHLPQTGLADNLARLITMMGAALFAAFISIVAIKREKVKRVFVK